jgi:hypothetical protein
LLTIRIVIHNNLFKSALGKLRQEDHKFQAILGYKASLDQIDPV